MRNTKKNKFFKPLQSNGKCPRRTIEIPETVYNPQTKKETLVKECLKQSKVKEYLKK